jgi:tRNA A-37 threonylcarbamoyl transferase component Bud32
MPLKLHVVKGKEPGQVITVPDNAAVVIGRKNADVCLDDQMLSRQHMKVELREGQALIADLGSSNGTFLNGDRVSQGRLADGDKIKIGAHIFHVEYSSGAAGAAGSAAAAARGLEAIAGAGAPTRREMVFCTACYRAVLRDDAREGPGGVRCPDCVEGSSFSESMIEGFKLIAKIADGRLGPVFKARHLTLMKYVLLKIVRSDQAVDERTLRRFAREAKIGGRLHHPNIVEMYDAAQSNGHYFITLELVDGETLEERVAKSAARRLDAREVARVGAGVAEALRHAWDTQRVIHRNVKPSNIFLGKKGEVKLGDFGLAKSLDPTETLGEGSVAGEPWGTLHFMPPEQLEDARSVDARADVYALGGALYFAVTGVRPFESASIGETLERIRAGALEPADKVAPKHCPRGLAACIARAMEKDRGRRFQSAAEMLQALQALGG